MSDKLLDQIFNLKFTSKQMVRQSIRAEKDEKEEKLKVSRHGSCFQQCRALPLACGGGVRGVGRGAWCMDG